LKKLGEKMKNKGWKMRELLKSGQLPDRGFGGRQEEKRR
jgi:hypothetical protein